MKYLSTSLVVCFFIFVAMPSRLIAREELKMSSWLQLDVNAMFVGEWIAQTRFMSSPTYGGRLGLSFNKRDVFLHIEHAFWGEGTGVDRADEQLLNFGIGTGHRLFKGLMRTSVTVGISVLLNKSQMAEAGSMGFYVEARPPGFRWKIGRTMYLEFSPLYFSFIAPVTESVPLVHITYRTAIAVEFGR